MCPHVEPLTHNIVGDSFDDDVMILLILWMLMEMIIMILMILTNNETENEEGLAVNFGGDYYGNL